jgi:hypothetical protein
VRLEQLLEVRGRFERMKRRHERAALAVDEPFADEAVERNLLRHAFGDELVVGGPCGRCRLAIDEELGFAVATETVDGILELELRAG